MFFGAGSAAASADEPVVDLNRARASIKYKAIAAPVTQPRLHPDESTFLNAAGWNAEVTKMIKALRRPDWR